MKSAEQLRRLSVSDLLAFLHNTTDDLLTWYDIDEPARERLTDIANAVDVLFTKLEREVGE